MLGKLNRPAEINVSEIKSLDLKGNNGRAIFHLPRAVVALCMTYGACVCFQGEPLRLCVLEFYILWLGLQGCVIS